MILCSQTVAKVPILFVGRQKRILSFGDHCLLIAGYSPEGQPMVLGQNRIIPIAGKTSNGITLLTARIK